MKIVNPITMSIIKKVKNGDTIRKVAKKTGFAYSAIYKWIRALSEINVLELKKHGNKTEIFVNKNLVYKKFIELSEVLSTLERDKIFWNLMKKTKYKVRFVEDTTAVIWTQGGYVTGDFYDKIYHIEVLDKDFNDFRKLLKRYNINFGKINRNRPFVCIKTKRNFNVARKNDLPVMPLKELILWCKKLKLDSILEQLNLMYDLGMKVKYSEVFTNV
ncbi:MAG: helix-turn-helix domain-containing protein [Candidatus Aenigmarchaeota archaeon]|nr:helix-turn-helix domain-containing protein [Candidatus Aenigmarchaeota archaeon]